MVKPHSPIAECRHRGSVDFTPTEKLRPGYLDDSACLLSNDNNNHRPVSCSPKRPRRSVTFCPRIFVREVVHRNNLSREDAEQMWLTMDDFEGIKQHIRLTLRMMRRNELGDDDEDDHFCSRGLENKTREGQRIRCFHKQQQRMAVLRVQDTQRREGLDDPEFIAIVSSNKSALSAKQAHCMALQDEEAAREIQSGEDRGAAIWHEEHL